MSILTISFHFATFGSSVSALTSCRYYAVVWCKLSRKKHKNWEGDAVLIVKGRSVVLKVWQRCHSQNYQLKNTNENKLNLCVEKLNMHAFSFTTPIIEILSLTAGHGRKGDRTRYGLQTQGSQFLGGGQHAPCGRQGSGGQWFQLSYNR